MSLLWHILAQFLFRLAFGIALSMGITSPRLVASGFYRVHMWVLLGLNTLAALVIWTHSPETVRVLLLTLPIVGAVACYVGAVCWLYEKPRQGMAIVWLAALLALAAAFVSFFSDVHPDEFGALSKAFHGLDIISSGLLLGTTTTAMLLGHWYLNAPGMKLAPLQRLVAAMAGATLLRAVVAGAGLVITSVDPSLAMPSVWFILLRWLAGIVSTLIVAWMTWQTLKIPNTQSATGILYVGVIVVFLGELASLLLSAGALYPL